MQPGHHLRHGCHHLSGSLPRRPVDQDDRQAKRARRVQLCPSTVPAGILGHKMRDAMCLHQRAITGLAEWSPRYHSFRIGQGQISHQVNQPQQVMVLGLCSEGRQMLSANGQKSPDGRVRQSRNRTGDLLHDLPVIARFRQPCGPFERDKGYIRCRTGQSRIPAHLGRERVRRINHMADVLRLQVGHQPLNPAKSPHPHRDRLDHRGLSASGIGKHGVKACQCQRSGKFTGLRRAAEQKDACHG